MLRIWYKQYITFHRNLKICHIIIEIKQLVAISKTKYIICIMIHYVQCKSNFIQFDRSNVLFNLIFCIKIYIIYNMYFIIIYFYNIFQIIKYILYVVIIIVNGNVLVIIICINVVITSFRFHYYCDFYYFCYWFHTPL